MSKYTAPGVRLAKLRCVAEMRQVPRRVEDAEIRIAQAI
jgi:hypothetical protein